MSIVRKSVIGEFVKKRRLEQNLNHRNFCKKAGLDLLWSQVEFGTRSPTQEELEKVSAFIGVDIGELQKMVDQSVFIPHSSEDFGNMLICRRPSEILE